MMIKTRSLTCGFVAAALLTTSACVTDPNTGEKKISRTAIGGQGQERPGAPPPAGADRRQADRHREAERAVQDRLSPPLRVLTMALRARA